MKRVLEDCVAVCVRVGKREVCDSERAVGICMVELVACGGDDVR